MPFGDLEWSIKRAEAMRPYVKDARDRAEEAAMTDDSEKKRQKLRMLLEIRMDDIDNNLIEQPGYFGEAAEAYAEAMAQRDEAKLELKEVTAELDMQLRKKYAEEEQKVTEALLEKHLTTLPRIQKLAREVIELSAEVERWLAIKESYSQRSFMLREVVAKYIAELNHLGLERSSGGSRADLANAREAYVNKARKEKLAARPLRTR